MSLKSLYESFLKAPNATLLSPDASLHYVTTLTSFQKAEAIEKHLSSQHRLVVRNKGDKFLNVVEGPTSLCVELETTLEFVTGGGAYLPGLDDNFLTDKVVSFPMVHVVQFENGKIDQIRLHWDQGALLKMLDVIGSRGRNWPIRDVHDQLRLITKSSSSAKQQPTNGHTVDTTTTAKDPIVPTTPTESMSPSKKHVRDPHASLSLFAEQEPPAETTPSSFPQSVAPRSSAKPPPREYSELFAANDSDSTPTKSVSPKKENRPNVIAPKGGAGKNYQPSRLFGDDAEPEQPSSAYKPNSKKYHHFEFGDGEDADATAQPKAIAARPKSKGHMSQWDFADFTTVDKPTRKARSQEVRHFGWSDDEGELAGSPGKHPRVINPRRDAETHFKFLDDGTPSGEKKLEGRAKGSAHNAGLGLYQNNLYDEEGNEPNASDRPLGTITNGVARKKDFGAQFSMTDSSPASSNVTKGAENRPLAGDRMKAVKMMDASWDSYDYSPEQQTSRPGALRKGTERHWGYGDEDDANETGGSKTTPGSKNFWDF